MNNTRSEPSHRRQLFGTRDSVDRIVPVKPFSAQSREYVSYSVVIWSRSLVLDDDMERGVEFLVRQRWICMSLCAILRDFSAIRKTRVLQMR